MPRHGSVRMVAKKQLNLMDRLEKNRHFFPETAGPAALRGETSMFEQWVKTLENSKSGSKTVTTVIRLSHESSSSIPPCDVHVNKRHFMLIYLPPDGDSAWDEVDPTLVLEQAFELDEDHSVIQSKKSSASTFSDVLIFQVAGFDDKVAINTHQVLTIPGEIAIACSISFHQDASIRMPALYRGGMPMEIKPCRDRTVLVIVDSILSQKDASSRMESIMLRATKNPKIMSEFLSSLMDSSKMAEFMKMLEQLLGISASQAMELFEKFKTMDIGAIKDLIQKHQPVEKSKIEIPRE